VRCNLEDFFKLSENMLSGRETNSTEKKKKKSLNCEWQETLIEMSHWFTVDDSKKGNEG
jgi:hypothetical protein